jgi:mRNA interferase RelE/StbE
MTFEVIIPKKCQKEFRKLPSLIKPRILILLESLVDNPKPVGFKQLVDSNPPQFRLRTGDYRLGYEIDYSKKQVHIFKIGHRRDFYENIINVLTQITNLIPS